MPIAAAIAIAICTLPVLVVGVAVAAAANQLSKGPTAPPNFRSGERRVPHIETQETGLLVLDPLPDVTQSPMSALHDKLADVFEGDVEAKANWNLCFGNNTKKLRVQQIIN